MKDEINIPDNLKGSAKENPFRTPDGYFDHLHVRISNRIHAEQASWFSRVFNVIKPQLAFAMTFVVFASVAYIGYKFIAPQHKMSYEQELVSYLMNEAYYMDENTIATAFDSQEEVKPEEMEQAIMDYLMNEDVEVNLLMNDL
jgi:hypothetical protein